MVGDGTQTRDFLYVTDVASAFLAAAETPRSGRVYNLGAGKPQSVNRLVELLGGEKIHIPKRPGEPDCTWADITRITSELGWRPRGELRGGRGEDSSPTSTTGATRRCGIRIRSPRQPRPGSTTWAREALMTLLLAHARSTAHKIKTAEELKAIIGPRPRAKKVIMCHGMFDVVHPGHLRHLLYAKSKADILVASLTADEHISKGQYRPHVPQDLRALNLAAFEMVDYVVIDRNATPLQNLALIQPDFFAKGYEYTASGLPPKTQEEIDALQSYGGEMIFTPGDIVYSSSTLIELAPPSIRSRSC